jgi:hypothetical protein
MRHLIVDPTETLARSDRGRGAGREPVRVVIRFDDCSAQSPLELERRLIAVAHDLGAAVTLGVIPFRAAGDVHDPRPQRGLALPPEKVAVLRQAAAAGAVEVALHGYAHQLHGPRHLGEFAARPRAEQLQRLRAGRAELENRLEVAVTSFIPPWNGYDQTTLDALEELGLDCLSASLAGPFPARARVGFLPATCGFAGLPDAARAALGQRRLGPVIVVLLHDYDFVESGHEWSWLTLAEYGRQLKRLAAEPGVRFCTLRQACREGVAFPPASLVPYQSWLARVEGFPRRIGRHLEDQVLWRRLAEDPSGRAVGRHQVAWACRRVVRGLGRHTLHRLRAAVGGRARPPGPDAGGPIAGEAPGGTWPAPRAQL